MSDLSYCAEQVKRFDPDRFLLTQFVPQAKREDLYALYAFNLELAKIRETISQPIMGQIRAQWWRDLLSALSDGSVPSHPIAQALAEIIARYDLPVALLHRMIDAREQDFSEQPPRDIAELEAYAEATAGGMLELAALILEAKSDLDRKAAKDIGTAYALAGLLRAVPYHQRQKRFHLPETPNHALRDVVRDAAIRARLRIADARSIRSTVSPQIKPLLRSAIQAEAWLNRLHQADYDCFNPMIAERHTPFLRLIWASLIGIY